MKKQKHSVYVDTLDITLSTGSLAKLTNGAVSVQCGDTSVFVTATAADAIAPEQSFFPLTVDYREKFAAAGRFPGGYFKREGRPSEKEILTSRLCDRPLRPLFPKGFLYEVQIIGMLLSADLANEPDVLMVNGASAALMCSDIPFAGPIGCVRVGEVNGQFVINPTNDEIFQSRLDLIYVGNEKDMLMIEGSADQISEERFIEALEYAHKAIQPLLEAQKELAKKAEVQKRNFDLVELDMEVFSITQSTIENNLLEALFKEKKKARTDAINLLKEKAKAAIEEKFGEEKFNDYQLSMAFDKLQENVYRKAILEEEKRADGRSLHDLRNIQCETSILPRVHGSALFERGETQALVLTTLGTSRDTQELDALTGGAQSKSFILHYNFPPFSVGETGRIGGAGRREIGHGALAERSLLPVLPSEDNFPYSIRLVSEILESNGSSSMASVCGGSLALMDAGVPLLSAVAGISGGLVTEKDAQGNIHKYKLLTDILGSEDHYGDMDFKIAGTQKGITGFQLDLKINGLPIEIAKESIFKLQEARIKILAIMEKAQATHNQELKDSAPRVHSMQIDPEKIGALIGPGGKNIKRITELTGAQIDINEDNSGQVMVFSNNADALKYTIEEIEKSVGEIEMGKTYLGTIKSVKEYGAFVECIPGKEGLVHVSELAENRVENVEDVCQEGNKLMVKCVGFDERGRVRLSHLAVICEQKGIPYEMKSNPSPSSSRSRSWNKDGRKKMRS